jgi:hypothetical protein
MSSKYKKPRRTVDYEFIDVAVKLITREGYNLAAAAKAVHVLYTILRQSCQKRKTVDPEPPDQRKGSNRTTRI